MNKLKIGIISALALAGSIPAKAQFKIVNPVPQNIQSTGFAQLPQSFNIKTSNNRDNSFAIATLKNGIKVEPNAKYTITLGIKGDKCVKAYAKHLPKKAEAYWLSIGDKGAIIVGYDEEGLFYGIQTFLGSIAKGKLETGTVTDWPDVDFRGTVEGFYGTPWSHKARLSQIEFYGRNKMNTYIYGPKDDPYHRDQWRKPYPTEEANRIKELNEVAKKNGVNFYWAIHPGVDIKWNNEDRDNLIHKLEMMYALGIRSFAVFFDDIWGEGAKADKQAELLNYVDDNFINRHKGISPLIMCPTEYNKAWANDEKGYLRTLGTKMNKDIRIMWTGNTVVHCIDKESMQWINSRIDRKAYVWWNFPVSDFVRDHVLLGPAYGNGKDIAGDVSGFVSNPMEHAEASKISLYGIADYTWNMKAYNAETDWLKGIEDLLPGNAEALRTFALYNKDLGQNGHGFRREEGEELKDIATAAVKGDRKAIEEINTKCLQLKNACDLLLADKTNKELIRELRPWLLQAKNLADYGTTVVMMNQGNANISFNNLYQQATSIQEQMFELENSAVRHALQPGIKVGTKVMLPTLQKLFSLAVDNYNKQNGTNLSNVAEYMPYKLTSNVEQLRLLPISIKNSNVNVAPSNEVINWQKDGFIEIETEHVVMLNNMDFNFDVENIAGKFKLEVMTNGSWQPISLSMNKRRKTLVNAGSEIDGLKAKKLRLTNTSGEDLKVYFRSFKFATK